MILNPPNFRRQALEFLGPRVDKFVGRHASLKIWVQLWVEVLADKSIKSFILPDDGKIIEHDAPTKISFDGLRLPYDKCFLEYRLSPPTDGEDGYEDTAMILLLTQDENFISVAALVRGKKQDGSGEMWLPFTTGARFDSTGYITDGDDKSELSCIALALSGSDDPDDDQLKGNMGDIRRAAEFILLCNCGNVTPQKMYTPNESMQKKALRNNRAPFNDYYALDISIPGEGRPSGAHNPSEPTGRHVRLHTRRGHIRRLPEGYVKPFTWVRAATVGSVTVGQVASAYRVRSRTDLSAITLPAVDAA